MSQTMCKTSESRDQVDPMDLVGVCLGHVQHLTYLFSCNLGPKSKLTPNSNVDTS